jgi:hypothetical protein
MLVPRENETNTKIQLSLSFMQQSFTQSSCHRSSIEKMQPSDDVGHGFRADHDSIGAMAAWRWCQRLLGRRMSVSSGTA